MIANKTFNNGRLRFFCGCCPSKSSDQYKIAKEIWFLLSRCIRYSITKAMNATVFCMHWLAGPSSLHQLSVAAALSSCCGWYCCCCCGCQSGNYVAIRMHLVSIVGVSMPFFLLCFITHLGFASFWHSYDNNKHTKRK